MPRFKRITVKIGSNVLTRRDGTLDVTRISALVDQVADLRRRGIAYDFDASTFWLWGVLGSLIVVGPFIYTHKLLKAMNLLAANYNIRG